MQKFTIPIVGLILVAVMLVAGCTRDQSGDADNPLASTRQDLNRAEFFKGEPTSYGNCLSTPVIFAEGHGLTGADLTGAIGLRGAPGVESFISPYDDVTYIDGNQVYRNPSINEWQADWADGTAWGGEIPVEIDWADNVTRQTWNERSKVRVEVVLYAVVDPGIHQLYGYNMYSLGGEQLDEIFVTNKTKYEATLATVYSNVARMTVEKLDGEGGNPIALLYDSPCYEGYFLDGPNDAYSAEVNMGGKCIYGYNWDVRNMPLDNKVGWYRLTFSLDDNAAYTDGADKSYSYPRNTLLTTLNPGDVLGNKDPEVVVYPPKLSESGRSCVLDVYIKAKSGGKK